MSSFMKLFSYTYSFRSFSSYTNLNVFSAIDSKSRPSLTTFDSFIFPNYFVYSKRSRVRFKLYPVRRRRRFRKFLRIFTFPYKEVKVGDKLITTPFQSSILVFAGNSLATKVNYYDSRKVFRKRAGKVISIFALLAKSKSKFTNKGFVGLKPRKKVKFISQYKKFSSDLRKKKIIASLSKFKPITRRANYLKFYLRILRLLFNKRPIEFWWLLSRRAFHSRSKYHSYDMTNLHGRFFCSSSSLKNFKNSFNSPFYASFFLPRTVHRAGATVFRLRRPHSSILARSGKIFFNLVNKNLLFFFGRTFLFFNFIDPFVAWKFRSSSFSSSVYSLDEVSSLTPRKSRFRLRFLHKLRKLAKYKILLSDLNLSALLDEWFSTRSHVERIINLQDLFFYSRLLEFTGFIKSNSLKFIAVKFQISFIKLLSAYFSSSLIFLTQLKVDLSLLNQLRLRLNVLKSNLQKRFTLKHLTLISTTFPKKGLFLLRFKSKSNRFLSFSILKVVLILKSIIRVRLALKFFLYSMRMRSKLLSILRVLLLNFKRYRQKFLLLLSSKSEVKIKKFCSSSSAVGLSNADSRKNYTNRTPLNPSVISRSYYTSSVFPLEGRSIREERRTRESQRKTKYNPFLFDRGPTKFVNDANPLAKKADSTSFRHKILQAQKERLSARHIGETELERIENKVLRSKPRAIVAKTVNGNVIFPVSSYSRLSRRMIKKKNRMKEFIEKGCVVKSKRIKDRSIRIVNITKNNSIKKIGIKCIALKKILIKYVGIKTSTNKYSNKYNTKYFSKNIVLKNFGIKVDTTKSLIIKKNYIYFINAFNKLLKSRKIGGSTSAEAGRSKSLSLHRFKSRFSFRFYRFFKRKNVSVARRIKSIGRKRFLKFYRSRLVLLRSKLLKFKRIRYFATYLRKFYSSSFARARWLKRYSSISNRLFFYFVIRSIVNSFSLLHFLFFSFTLKKSILRLFINFLRKMKILSKSIKLSKKSRKILSSALISKQKRVSINLNSKFYRSIFRKVKCKKFTNYYSLFSRSINNFIYFRSYLFYSLRKRILLVHKLFFSSYLSRVRPFFLYSDSCSSLEVSFSPISIFDVFLAYNIFFFLQPLPYRLNRVYASYAPFGGKLGKLLNTPHYLFLENSSFKSSSQQKMRTFDDILSHRYTYSSFFQRLKRIV